MWVPHLIKKRSSPRRFFLLPVAVAGIMLLGTMLLVIAAPRDGVEKANVAMVLGSKVDPWDAPSA